MKNAKMINLVEDKQAREGLIARTEVLDRVKVIPYLTSDLVIDTKTVSDYYGVGKKAIDSLLIRHKDELELNGLTILKGDELKEFKTHLQNEGDSVRLKRVATLALFTKRALLNVGMLLTDSEVAEKVRDYLLNIEENSTDEQKTAAADETIKKATMTKEELKEHNAKKLLNKQHREKSKLVKIQATIDRCTLYGIPKEEASFLVQKALAEGVKVETVILGQVEKNKELAVNVNRGIVREKIDYVANNCYDGDYEIVYHLMSEKMRFEIGFNMRAHRSRLKAANEKRVAKGEKKLDVPSYLDIIVEYNAFASADKVINALIDEKDEMKVKVAEMRAEKIEAEKAEKAKIAKAKAKAEEAKTIKVTYVEPKPTGKASQKPKNPKKDFTF
jgi:hypothetical protein